MNDFNADFFRDVPRGVSTRSLMQQRPPSARWMDVAKIASSAALEFDPLNPGKKILIGQLGEKLIGIEDDRHILTTAGSRSGKSVGLTSALHFYTFSVVVMDFKGELSRITARRRAAQGQRVFVLDPCLIASPSAAEFRASYNPMSLLHAESPTLLEDAAVIADSIIVTSGSESDPHWNESAQNFVETVTILVAVSKEYEGRRNLLAVRECLTRALVVSSGAPTDGSAKPKLLLELLDSAEELRKSEATYAAGSALFAGAMDFYTKEPKERSSVLSTVNRHTKFLDYPGFRDILCTSDFELADLKRHSKGVSLYVCVPPTKSRLAKRWMRIIVNQLLAAMERENTETKAPVLLCLDEFPVLGYMSQLEDAVGSMAGFGVKLWTILQDWNQGKALYGDRWETFAANSGVMQFFGNNDQATTKYVSERLGKAAVGASRLGETAADQRDKGLLGKSEAIEYYDLLTPDEITRQFARHDRLARQLVMWAGYHPMMLQRATWYDRKGPVAKVIRETDPLKIKVA